MVHIVRDIVTKWLVKTLCLRDKSIDLYHFQTYDSWDNTLRYRDSQTNLPSISEYIQSGLET